MLDGWIVGPGRRIGAAQPGHSGVLRDFVERTKVDDSLRRVLELKCVGLLDRRDRRGDRRGVSGRVDQALLVE